MLSLEKKLMEINDHETICFVTRRYRFIIEDTYSLFNFVFWKYSSLQL